MVKNDIKAPLQPLFYRGVVEDNEDPEKLGRLKVRIFGIHSDDDGECPTDSLPWAEMAVSLNHGFISGVGYSYVPLKGTYVWVFLDCGNEDKPVVFAACPGISTQKDSGSFSDPDGTYPLDERLNESDYNRLARNDKVSETDIEISLKAHNDKGVPTATGGSWNEPETLNSSGAYPTNTVLETKSGHTIQVDDTDSNERIHVFHKTGSYVEIRPNGDVTIHSINDKYEIVEGTENRHTFIDSNETINANATRIVGLNNDEIIGVDETRTIGNNQTITIGNNQQITIGNNRQLVVGNNKDQIVGNNFNEVVGNNSTHMIGSNRTTTIGANETLMAGGNIIIFGSMTFIN